MPPVTAANEPVRLAALSLDESMVARDEQDGWYREGLCKADFVPDEVGLFY